MLKPEELRIGNLVHNNSTGTDLKVSIDDIRQVGKSLMLLSNPPKPMFQPIPLTPERLERLGFVTVIEEGIQPYCKEGIEVYVTDAGECSVWFRTLHLGNYNHVHSLQNLFFCLTGEELQYTP